MPLNEVKRLGIVCYLLFNCFIVIPKNKHLVTESSRFDNAIETTWLDDYYFSLKFNNAKVGFKVVE